MIGKRYLDGVVQENAGKVEMNYIEMSDSYAFQPLGEKVKSGGPMSKGPGVILSGALWIGRMRLIDNVLLGEVGWIFEQSQDGTVTGWDMNASVRN